MREKNIPIMIHHEGNQHYLYDCICQTKKYNQNVILLGDASNKDMPADTWYNAAEFTSKEWEEFLAVFVNMSTYPDDYAKQIFKRLFMVHEILEKKNIDECILLDSDVLCYCNFSELDVFNGCDVSLSVRKNQEPYIWSVSTGSSYWTVGALSNFCRFCIDFYRNRIDVLKEKWLYMQKHHFLGGVCEMSLLYLWTLEYTGKILNTTRIFDGVIMDGGIASATNYDYNEFEFNKMLGIKKIRFKKGIPYLRDSEGRDIETLVLHFGGKVKAYMRFYKKPNLVNRMLVYLAAIALKVFGK